MKLCQPPAIEMKDFYGIYTVSPQMEALFGQLKRVARTDATVLIRGESGTGKELVARALHDLSGRSKGPFKAINCATLNPELLASELFGHVRGAFTGAVKDRVGLFAAAHKGTIFLDEIAEISLDVQARLLRVLQERTFVPLGATEPVQVDVRVLSATNKSLREEVEQRRFREDLMYRVRVVPLFLPRLADREGDVEALTWHFIAQFNQQGWRHVEAVEANAMQTLLRYPWPGNIRELRNVIEHAFAIGEGPVLTCADLTPELRGELPPHAVEAPSTARSLERDRIVEALRQARSRKAEAAALLGMSRSTLWRKMREYQLA
jgi:two-component system response regulator AtoC